MAPTLLSTLRPAEDWEVQASKSMMQKLSLHHKTSNPTCGAKTLNRHFPSRNSGLRNMDLLGLRDKDSQALNFCFFWFKPKEDAPPAERRKKI